jgi:hypothetical protein
VLRQELRPRALAGCADLEHKDLANACGEHLKKPLRDAKSKAADHVMEHRRQSTASNCGRPRIASGVMNALAIAARGMRSCSRVRSPTMPTSVASMPVVSLGFRGRGSFYEIVT